jgi:putative hydrolase of the HAD superfamily
MTPRQHSKWAQPPPVALTFDLVHTLIHTPRRVEIYREIFRRHGSEVVDSELARTIPEVWAELSCRADPRRDRFATHRGGAEGWWYRFFCRLAERLAVPRPSRFAAADLFASFSRAEAWEIYPDVLPTLQALRDAGFLLGVVSNWDHRLPLLLDRLGLVQYFDAVAYSAAVGVEKPNPEIFLHCTRRLGVTPAQTLHVGDRVLEDVEGALAAGIRALKVDRRLGQVSLQTLLKPMVEMGAAGRGISLKGEEEEGRHVVH